MRRCLALKSSVLYVEATSTRLTANSGGRTYTNRLVAYRKTSASQSVSMQQRLRTQAIESTNAPTAPFVTPDVRDAPIEARIVLI